MTTRNCGACNGSGMICPRCGATAEDACECGRMSTSDVRDKCEGTGISVRLSTGYPGWTPQEEQELRRLHALGQSCGQIGKALGKTRHAIIGKVTRLGLQARATPSRPVKTAPKLRYPKPSSEDVERIRDQRDLEMLDAIVRGEPIGMVARGFGVTLEYARDLRDAREAQDAVGEAV